MFLVRFQDLKKPIQYIFVNVCVRKDYSHKAKNRFNKIFGSNGNFFFRKWHRFATQICFYVSLLYIERVV